MSVWAQSWAYEQRAGSGGAKAVLVALAVFADEDGYCYPSQERIAGMTEQGVRTVRLHLAALEKSGLIRRERRRRPDGSWTSDGFNLIAPADRLRPHIPAPSETLRQILPPADIAAGGLVAIAGETENGPAADSATGESCLRQIPAQPAAKNSQRQNLPGNSHREKEDEPSGRTVIEGGRATARASPSRNAPLPETFVVTKGMWEWAYSKSMERDFIKRETEKFVAHFRSSGGTKKDWTMAWHKWLLTAQEGKYQVRRNA